MSYEETQKFFNEILAKQRYAQLIQRMKKPKNRNALDILEYQSLMAQISAKQEEAEPFVEQDKKADDAQK